MTENRVVAYIRANGKDPAVSAQRQEHACREYARQHGLEVVEVMTDLNVARGQGHLPALVGRLQEGVADGVIVYNVDRVSRSRYVIGDILRHGFLVSASDPRFDSRRPIRDAVDR